MTYNQYHKRFPSFLKDVLQDDVEDLALKEAVEDLKKRRACGGPDMTDKQYLTEMMDLFKKLEKASTAEPYEPWAYNDVVVRINALHQFNHFVHRRYPWAALISVLMLLFALLLIVFEIFKVLYTKGTT